jgi:FkbM family methyltransferase
MGALGVLRKAAFAALGHRIAYRVGRSLYQFGRREIPNEMASNGEMLVQSCVVDAWKRGNLGKSRLIAFDVGANIGDWSSSLLERLDDGDALDIYAFEPVPATMERLRRRLGPAEARVRCEMSALSDARGERTIFVAPENGGTSSLHSPSVAGGGEQAVTATDTVVDFCERNKIPAIHLLKCDTEGHDMSVIRGSERMLRAGSISVLQFEYNHRWIFSRNFLRDAFELVDNLPYKVAKLGPDGVLILDRWHPELERFFEGNYALIHADALSWFPARMAIWDRYNRMIVA